MMKHMAADAKEKVGNVTAKAEEKMEKAKASATEKSDKAMAHDKAGKLEATERKHEREAVAQHSKDQKQIDNAHQAGQVKQDIKEGKATSHQPDLTSANPMTNQGLAAQGGTAGLTQAPGPGAATPV